MSVFTPDSGQQQQQQQQFNPGGYTGIQTDLQPPAIRGTDDVIDVQVPPREVKHLAFRLSPDPHIYHLKAAKTAVFMLPMMDGPEGVEGGVTAAHAIFEWLGQGLSKEDNERIVARLHDPEDDLDMDTLMATINTLVERTTNRPSS